VPGLILAAVNPDNTPHGYNWTFAFPMLLFIIIALILYALFSRPHRRVPGRPISATQGGGSTESHHEPAGPAAAAASEPGGAHLTGSVNADDEVPQDSAESGEGTEATE
jgi:hypothetical protein